MVMKLYSFQDHLGATDSFRIFCQHSRGHKSLEEFQPQIGQLKSYIYSADSDWCLDQRILDLMERILLHGDEELRERFVRLLCICATRTNFYTLLLNDRSHVILKYCLQFVHLSSEEQRFVSILLLNISSTEKGIDYLMFFSPWEHETDLVHNCQACQSILSRSLHHTNPNVRQHAWRLMANLSSRHTTYSSRPQTLRVYTVFVNFVRSYFDEERLGNGEDQTIIELVKKNMSAKHNDGSQ